MKRIFEIITDIRNRHPGDDFFSDFEESYRISPQKKKHYRNYNDALMILDNCSWQILKNKALEHYFDHRNGQKKQGLFNQLNEAFAYQYLIRKGFNDVRFIKEDGKSKSPDIGFSIHSTQRHCEVKTLGISDKEIDRRNSGTVYDGSVYTSLNDEFLDKKFRNAYTTARKQICAFGTDGLVFIIIMFDDIALDYYSYYKKQLISFSETQGFDDLYIKIGLLGNNRGIYITKPSYELKYSADGRR